MLKLKYYNPIYSIAFSHWKEMYLLSKEPILLIPELYQGKLVYRPRDLLNEFLMLPSKKDCF